MPKYCLYRDGELQEVQEVSLQDWLQAAVDAELNDWFENVGTLESPLQLETLRAVAKVVIEGSMIAGEGSGGDQRFIRYAKKLESLIDGWRIVPEASSATSIPFQNDKGICFELNLLPGDAILFQSRVTEEQRMAVRSDFKLPKMQAHLTKSVDSISSGLKMGFLRDMDLLSTLISMWEKKAVKTR